MKRGFQWTGLFLFSIAGSQPLFANRICVDTDTDTLKNFNIEEAVIVASPKEHSFLKEQPLAASWFGKKDLDRLGVNSVKDLSAFVPNFYMPDYGSRLTSAVYVRGIGSRVNTPAVGLYVDNVAYTDKSAYDFSFLDVERVDVLRGPQGTLYGRNTMGGLMRVFTADPLKKTGTNLQLGGATQGGPYSAKATTYLHPSDHFAISVGGFYEGQAGFFDNVATGKEADGSSAGGGKIRAAWKPNAALRFDLTTSYEYSDEDACPYYLEKENQRDFPSLAGNVGQIAQNRQSNYRRGLFNTGLSAEWKTPKFILNSVTGYQNLDDRLMMDQDFSDLDVFSLTQSQRMNAITEELSLKNHQGGRWQWTSGAFFMYQKMNTDCPVHFYEDGIGFLNNQFKRLKEDYPTMPSMGLTITNSQLPFSASMETPNWNAALFHQSTLHDLFVEGLSLTVGLRLDYDRHELTLASALDEPIKSKFWFMNPATEKYLNPVDAVLNGELENDSWQLLPKLALQYDFSKGNVYAAVSKGYRSGGYNIQAYSDLSQQLLRRNLILEAMSTMKPGKTGRASFIPDAPNVSDLYYKAEESWNYEIGGHLSFCDGTVEADYSLFFLQTKNQQLARFAESGMGRVTVNAGKSQTLGGEFSVRTYMLDRRLNLSAAYGYTHAQLKDHNLGQVDYSDHRVPFAPEHTVGAFAEFRQPLSSRILKSVNVGADVQGAGRIYWDEANTFSQPFYATLGLHAGFELTGNIQFAVWAKNLTDAKYDAFSFESMGNRFAQRGTPRHFGMNLNVHF